MVSIAESFQAGLAFHAAGELAQAELVCRQVLQAEPRHPGAAHLLGLIAPQVGQHQTAIVFMSA